MRTVSARGLPRGGVSNFARKVVVDDYLTPGPSSATIAASFPKREAMRTLLRVDGSTKVPRKTNPLLHRELRVHPPRRMTVDLPPLDAWTYDTVVDMLRQHEFEPGRFDYKAVLNTTSPKGRDGHAASIRRTACAMANTDGGFILFGIKDRKAPVRNAEERIVGIPPGELRKQFGDKLQPLQPEVYFEALPASIPVSGD